MLRPPLIIDVTRGSGVESRHRVHAVVSDCHGHVSLSYGDEGLAIFPRSAIKPLQALPLVESGAARALNLSPFQLSLACASHNGEPLHTDAVADWLNQLGVDEGQLICAGHWSINQAALIDQVRRRGLSELDGLSGLDELGSPRSAMPTQRHNNCSGKHCGLLSLAQHMGAPMDGYWRADHPVQQQLLRTLQDMTHARLDMGQAGIDGCGIPTIPVPLAALARAFAHWANPVNQPKARQDAIEQISNAIWDHPLAMAGTGRYCSRVNALKRADGIDVLVKTGAEGVFCAALPSLGLGIALKVEDGATRASEVALTTLLDQLNLFADASNDTRALINTLKKPGITNWANDRVGEIDVY